MEHGLGQAEESKKQQTITGFDKPK